MAKKRTKKSREKSDTPSNSLSVELHRAINGLLDQPPPPQRNYKFDAEKVRPEDVRDIAENVAHDISRNLWVLMPVDDDYRTAQAMYGYLVENDVVNPLLDRQVAARFIQYAMKNARAFIASQTKREEEAAKIEEQENNG